MAKSIGLWLLACWECGLKSCNGGMDVCPWECCVLMGRGVCIRLITHPENSYRVWSVQWVRPRSPIRGGHDPESGQSATGNKYFYLYQWNILTGLTTIACFNLYRSSSGYSKCNEFLLCSIVIVLQFLLSLFLWCSYLSLVTFLVLLLGDVVLVLNCVAWSVLRLFIVFSLV
jgi:hypothetical protein